VQGAEFDPGVRHVPRAAQVFELAQSRFVAEERGQALLARDARRGLRRGAARAEELLARYGYGKAIVLSRFVPVVRTVVSPVAGALGVPVRTFTAWQVLGSVAWSQSLVLAGYALGSSVPDVERYLLPLVALTVALSFLPMVIELRRGRPDGGKGDRQA
jgi:membrane-associated protein